MGIRRTILRLGLAGLLTAAATVASAQYIPPPPPPIPPNFSQFPNQYKAAPQLGYRCATQAGVCLMNAPGPVGTICTCVTPMGYISGQIFP